MRVDPITGRLFEFHTDEGAGATALGTGETPSPNATESAGTENTDNGGAGGEPGPIPYSRFKEVNDELSSLKGFKSLVDVGYDADSLRQLAEFEAGFRADPALTWLSIANNIEELPPVVKAAVQQHLAGATGKPNGGKAEGTPEDDDMPEWAKKLIAENEELKAAENQRRQREVSQATNETLDGIMKKWADLDTKDEIKSPDHRKMLTFIVAHSQTSDNPDKILENARKEWLEHREDILGSVLKPGGSGDSPLSVPSGGAPANGSPEPKTLAEASRRALARLNGQ